MPFASGGTRRNALNKLAALSAQTATSDDDSDDIARLCKLTRSRSGVASTKISNPTTAQPRLSAVPMSAREFEVLVALCKAAPIVQTFENAEQLFDRLLPYVPEAHKQALDQITLHQRQPPWETLSHDLTAAILALASNHSSLRDRAIHCIDLSINEFEKFAEKAIWLHSEVENSKHFSSADKALPAIQLTTSLIGFLHALSHHTKVCGPQQIVDILQRFQHIISEEFMVSVEGSLSAIRNTRIDSVTMREWKRWIRHYSARGSPLGVMALQQSLMDVAEQTLASMLSIDSSIPQPNALDWLLRHIRVENVSPSDITEDLIEQLTDLAIDKISFLAADADYLQLSSTWQQRLALAVKASSLRCYLYCSLLDDAIADDDVLLSWFESITTDQVQMGDENLAQTVLKSMTILSRVSKATALNLYRSLPKLLVQGKMPPATAHLAGECLALVLQQLSKDIIISTLYSLGNVLSSSGNEKAPGLSPFFDGGDSTNGSAGPYSTQQVPDSMISLIVSDEEVAGAVYASVIHAIGAIAMECDDEQTTSLVLSILVQKIGRINTAVDARIIMETATLGICGSPSQLKSLLRLYARLASEATSKHDNVLLSAVSDARNRLAVSIGKQSPLFEVYLTHLLSLCVSSVDTPGEYSGSTTHAVRSITDLFRPLASLLSTDTRGFAEFEHRQQVFELNRDAWFSIVIQGYTLNAECTKEYLKDLQIFAQHSLPIVDEERADLPESAIDLNPVLRRGAGGQQIIEQRSTLIAALPSSDSDIKGLSYQDCIFLNAALLISMLRARAGDCSAVLPYFLESKIKKTPMGNVMHSIAIKSVDAYLESALTGQSQRFTAPQIALQLAKFLEGACHRIEKVQVASTAAADRIIAHMPSALCHKTSLFALLELLSLLWQSCLDAETNEYEWHAAYISEKGNVAIHVSDDIQRRQATLTNFHNRSRAWVSRAIDISPLDIKGHLQAYLEDYEDDGKYGHISLGRSFAVEMGSLIPSTDQRLSSLGNERHIGVNTASDFIAQYTMRQRYRLIEFEEEPIATRMLEGHITAAQMNNPSPLEMDEVRKLAALAERLRSHHDIPFPFVRAALHDAAASISRYASIRTLLVADLVGIPFIIFTKQSINLGISLWLGVVKENPALESRILAEVAVGWENSIKLRKGFFNSSFHHLDPFYVKEEFAPSRWEAISRRQQITHDLLTPHLRLTYFLSSHFSASRLTAPSIEHIYIRLMRVTTLHMKHTITQPLAREVHFQILLLALRVLRSSTRVKTSTKWRLKDAILSAGLTWFNTLPRWSFGSNRLQVKAELKILNDVVTMLKSTSGIEFSTRQAFPALQTKSELLVSFLLNEMSRLAVWIDPLGVGAAANYLNPIKDTAFVPLVKAAWAEDPRIAVMLNQRYPHSQTLAVEIRGHLLADPERAVNDPYALNLLLGASLPSDVKTQLKYLLYWAPLDPISAVTFFLPAYNNHPSIIQYAVRALESHTVDVTFFYVPQIVQALRYDALGYVARYIIETAKFSQLFAHQIIWNMNANAYKDEDSQQPDAVKPVLDKISKALVDSFSEEDKGFYEREFDFFGKVTGISGTLKPFIKRPKPEKKQKIEEELRKIVVQVGVYLPSNPEGVVIGIDRKSGKPLQSHAKAPFMATFRIRKDLPAERESDNVEIEQNGELGARQTYEVWQSAIFKVGDDCRQDVLALQMIAAFRGIFNNVGLDVYVFPYRVTATAPGCGVIDVLPNAVSRDMLGREAVNGLYEYFISKYGSEDSVRFQQARNNFIKSMAAYSIISFLLQFKDRHNGNIMVDDAGHILHIDFGFCFDVVPGGIKFERAPFKLSPEMVAVMGGSPQSQPFRAFEELCVKAFLASRQYVEQLSRIVQTMLDSGLPCFKPQTMKHFRERFVLEKNDREAADFVRHLVHVSERSYSTGVYDYYQLLTNGIPY